VVYFLTALFIGSNDYGYFVNKKKIKKSETESRCRSRKCNTLHNNQ